MSATVNELTEQLIAATRADDIGEIKRLTDQISQKAKPQSFSEAWNYANNPPAPGSFESVWQFTKKGRED